MHTRNTFLSFPNFEIILIINTFFLFQLTRIIMKSTLRCFATGATIVVVGSGTHVATLHEIQIICSNIEKIFSIFLSHSATRIVPVSRYRFTKFIPTHVTRPLYSSGIHRTRKVIAHFVITEISRAAILYTYIYAPHRHFPRKIHFRHGRIAGLTTRGAEEMIAARVAGIRNRNAVEVGRVSSLHARPIMFHLIRENPHSF